MKHFFSATGLTKNNVAGFLNVNHEDLLYTPQTPHGPWSRQVFHWSLKWSQG